mmetsp:Transcript_12866/g.29102  ORF Transcript_12866/g.29102 Transcript_12866/m.29102 type:complete len:253 (-) Transcript_12866:540-1298(-)
MTWVQADISPRMTQLSGTFSTSCGPKLISTLWACSPPTFSTVPRLVPRVRSPSRPATCLYASTLSPGCSGTLRLATFRTGTTTSWELKPSCSTVMTARHQVSLTTAFSGTYTSLTIPDIPRSEGFATPLLTFSTTTLSPTSTLFLSGRSARCESMSGKVLQRFGGGLAALGGLLGKLPEKVLLASDWLEVEPAERVRPPVAVLALGVGETELLPFRRSFSSSGDGLVHLLPGADLDKSRLCHEAPLSTKFGR